MALPEPFASSSSRVRPQEKLEGVQKAVQGELNELNAGLQRRNDVAAARGILDLLQDTAHVASKVEKLLLEVEQQEGDLRKEAALDAKTRLLERVSSEVSRLSFYCNKGKVRLQAPRPVLSRHNRSPWGERR